MEETDIVEIMKLPEHLSDSRRKRRPGTQMRCLITPVTKIVNKGV